MKRIITMTVAAIIIGSIALSEPAKLLANMNQDFLLAETNSDKYRIQKSLYESFAALIDSPSEEKLRLSGSADEAVVTDSVRRIQALRGMESRIGAVFDQIENTIDMDNLTITDANSAEADFYVVTTIEYHYEGIDQSDDYAVFGTLHHVTYELAGDTWRITGDSFDERETTGAVSSDILDAEESILPASSGGSESNAGEETALMSVPSFQYTSTSVDAALQYAVQYCGFSAAVRRNNRNGISSSNPSPTAYYNQNYVYSFSSSTDCANFYSQCLLAAGFPTDDDWYPNANNAVWVGVDQLTDYLDNAYTRVQLVNEVYSSVYPGNPVFWLHDRNEEHGHVMICIGYNAAGVPIICAHTGNAYRMPITNYDYYADSSRHYLYTIQIAGSNLHTSHSAIGNAVYYDAGLHYRWCEFCETHIYSSHTPNALGVCTGCGATGPFIVYDSVYEGRTE